VKVLSPLPIRKATKEKVKLKMLYVTLKTLYDLVSFV